MMRMMINTTQVGPGERGSGRNQSARATLSVRRTSSTSGETQGETSSGQCLLLSWKIYFETQTRVIRQSNSKLKHLTLNRGLNVCQRYNDLEIQEWFRWRRKSDSYYIVTFWHFQWVYGCLSEWEYWQTDHSGYLRHAQKVDWDLGQHLDLLLVSFKDLLLVNKLQDLLLADIWPLQSLNIGMRRSLLSKCSKCSTEMETEK